MNFKRDKWREAKTFDDIIEEIEKELWVYDADICNEYNVSICIIDDKGKETYFSLTHEFCQNWTDEDPFILNYFYYTEIDKPDYKFPYVERDWIIL